MTTGFSNTEAFGDLDQGKFYRIAWAKACLEEKGTVEEYKWKTDT